MTGAQLPHSSSAARRWTRVAVSGLVVGAVMGNAAAEPDAKRSRAPAPIVFASLSVPAGAHRAPVVIEHGQSAADRLQSASYSRAPAFDAGASPRAPKPGAAEPYAGPPYQVDGRWFVPAHEPNYDEVGVASWYGPGFHGKATASGEIFDQNALTAAHPTLPIPSLVRVTNLDNGRSVVVRLNDRGPYKNDRIIDLSKGAADALGVTATGTAKVQVQYVGPAPAEPNSVPDASREQVRYQPPAAPVSQPAPQPVAEAPPQTETRSASQKPSLRTTAPVEMRSVETAGGKPFDTGYRPVGATPQPQESPPVVRAAPMTPLPSAATPPSAPWPTPEQKANERPEANSASPKIEYRAVVDGALYLQAGAFADLGNAHRLRDRVKPLANASVTAVQTPKGELYRVMIGPWRDADARRKGQAELAAIGVQSMAVSPG